jgi:PRTRC genetic system protein A
MNLVEYELHVTKLTPVLSEGKLYRYVLAANGVFVYSKNNYFEALIPVRTISNAAQFVRGLEPAVPFFKIIQKVNFELLQEAISMADAMIPLECLFYFQYLDKDWICYTPKQQVTRSSVIPDVQFGDYIPIEMHSHNTMDAIFSDTDNADETGFRVYGVIGHVDRPVVDIKMRISIYGHRYVIPYESVFERNPEARNV